MSRPTVLAGCRVLVTSDHGAEDLGAALTRHGAQVVHAPAVTTVSPLADEELAQATTQVIADRPGTVVETVPGGIDEWCEGADAVGLRDDLLDVLERARLVRATPGERDDLWERGLGGVHVAVQHRGAADPDLTRRLVAAGANVVPVVTHRWAPAPDPEAVRRSTLSAADGCFDAILLASPAESHTWIDAARGAAALAAVAERTGRGELLAACLDEASSLPLRQAGVVPVLAERRGLGALVRTVVSHYERPARSAVETVAGPLHLRSASAVLGDQVRPLSPGGMAALRLLVDACGGVVARGDLLDALPGDSASGHAVEVTIARLREALGDRRLVETVVRRGYRLALA